MINLCGINFQKILLKNLWSLKIKEDEDSQSNEIHIIPGQKIYIESHVNKVFEEEPLSLLYKVWNSYSDVCDYIYDDLYTPDIYDDINRTWDQPIGQEIKKWSETGIGIHIFETILN